MRAYEIIQGVTALGVGSGLGAVVAAFIAAKAEKGKARAEAADLLVGAAERVGKMNAQLDEEVGDLKSRMDHIQMAILSYLGDEISKSELLEMMKEFRR